MIVSLYYLKVSLNTFDKLFEKVKPRKLNSIKESITFVKKPRPNNERMLMRYVALLPNAGITDPFLELFALIRKKQTILNQ